MKNYAFLLLAVLLGFSSCKKDKDKDDIKNVSLTPEFDGFIVNSSPRGLTQSANGNCGSNLHIGWNLSGESIRSIISFDISSIIPNNGETLVVNKAVLKVYECNTSNHPFDGDNTTRTVEVSLIENGALSVSDYDVTEIAACGTIASWGYLENEEHTLSVISAMETFFNSGATDLSSLKFRIQFTNDDNVADTDNSDLDGSLWQIYAEEQNDEYVAKLDIEYKIETE
jgi:hypothetical protein